MKVLALTLVGNVRLQYSGTREVYYTPQSNIQLIIGNNGSGKSTILNELSPLPALKNDYAKGGSKEIDLYCRGYYYRLRSEFNKDQKHFFMRSTTLDGLAAGENLNDGHTLTVQKQLVETHFRYTNEIHELLLGNVRLTQLSPQKRKEWFVKLCNVDVTYAVEVYQRLATNARNVIGAKKHAEQKLLDEKSKLLSEDEIAELKTQIASLSKLSRAYSEAKMPVRDADVNAIEARLNSLLAEIDSLSRTIIATSTLTLTPAKNVTEYRELTETAKAEVSIIDTQIQSLKREYESIDELVALMSSDDGRSLEDLQDELCQLEAKRDTLHIDLTLTTREDLKGVFSDASQIVDSVDDLLLKMPKNTGLALFNREKVSQAESDLKVLTTQEDRCLFQIQQRERRIDELAKHKPTECPNCNHIWIPGVSENELTALEAAVTSLQQKVSAIQKNKEDLLTYLEKAHEWKDYYSRLSTYIRDYPRLTVVWDYFMQSGKVTDNPSSLVGYLRHFLTNVTQAIDVKTVLERIDLISAAITQREQLQGDKGKYLTQRARYLENALKSSQDAFNEAKQKYLTYKTTYDKVCKLSEQKDKLETLLETVSELLIRKDKLVKNAVLDDAIDTSLLSIAGLSKQLNDALGKTQIVDHLTTSVSELTLAEADYRLLLQSLSPTEGLIADSLMGFINTVTQQMNFIISKIWTSKISVRPCHAERGDLDYKFPLSFEGGLQIADVSLGSKGQKELIDYVFVLIAMIYLDLKDYPLLMDEVGHSFHDAHRIRLFDYIKQLLDQGTVGQVFVVSHFSNTHGSLTHADVNVIDNTGVLVPPHANRHFKLK